MGRKSHPAAEDRSLAADVAAGVQPNDADVVVHTDAEAAALVANGNPPPLTRPDGTHGHGPSTKSPPKSKRQRFLDHLDRRMIRARKALSAVARMGNKSGYEYTGAEAMEIWDAIIEGANEVKAAFEAKTRTASAVDWRSK